MQIGYKFDDIMTGVYIIKRELRESVLLPIATPVNNVR